jgi:hypothetical protein
MKKALAIIATISLAITWYWYEFKFPLKEFGRLGEIQFPENTKVIEWRNDGWSIKGKFQLPESTLETFINANSLRDGGFVAADSFVGNRCIHEGDNSVQIRISKQSGIAEIEIQQPDHAGDKPCSEN